MITVVVALAVIGLDQWAGDWAVHRLVHGPVHVLGPIELELGINTGAAFSLGRGWAPVFAVLAAVAVVVLVVASRRAWSDGLAVALGLVVGGAAGNLADRLFRPYHGGVVDFIHLPDWPTFNVSDACITVGVVAVALFLWRAPAAAPSPPDGGPPGGGGPPDGTTPGPPATEAPGPGPTDVAGATPTGGGSGPAAPR